VLVPVANGNDNKLPPTVATKLPLFNEAPPNGTFALELWSGRSPKKPAVLNAPAKGPVVLTVTGDELTLDWVAVLWTVLWIVL
jgi:hypothetical protein